MERDSKLKTFVENIKFPLLAILLSFLIGALFIIWTGNNPLVAYGALLSGSLGGLDRFGQTLLKTTPLIFTGLAVSFAFRCGLFNIGAEGQYVIGALTTVAAGYIFNSIFGDLPRFIFIPLVMLAGALGGALWAAIAGFLKSKLGVHEVITTIMLNYTSIHVSNFFVRTALNPSTLEGTTQKAYTVLLPESARLTQLKEIIPWFGYSSVHTGIFIAIICAIIAYFILFKTTLGYEIRSVGQNSHAAEYGGISVSKNLVLAMIISGMFAGLAGATQVAGLNYKVDMAPISPGYGFTGIAVALVGKNHPLGVLASALLFGILSNGARRMQIEGIPKEVVGIIQGIIIIFIAGERIIKFVSEIRERRNRKCNVEGVN
ncbi:nucleoside ABC transporter membrane protein [Caloranaerobacter azorensis DSM 13643]|uniref:Nucleoside ABC transporter membrane protein n=1 Tax=Caloranaerobacter azorensis DSM 13643 TaxID=1121264 RepID=A0A1M5SET0_9FIRM|nr:ABC transporter permease [Caloranaerobacter azorensis]SHH36930.1 nucleoside ABC transporter membrane protein [Caloranaerobacter azorensis DSM 13643]